MYILGANINSELKQSDAGSLIGRGLSKQFGGIFAVNDVSLTCKQGELLGLIGPNGAGKTTLLNLISGFIAPDNGEIKIGSERIEGLAPELCARAGVARTFQNIRLFGKLTVRQNIEVAYTTATRYRPGNFTASVPEKVISILNLEDETDVKAETLAYGVQRRVEIARALALSPSLLLLDEPAAGMNEQETSVLLETIKNIRQLFGCAIIVIDHDLRFIMNLCDRIYVMHMGEIIAEDVPSKIRYNERVQEVYLGNKKISEQETLTT